MPFEAIQAQKTPSPVSSTPPPDETAHSEKPAELERELVEKISELAAIKKHVEENTVEWAETIEALKAARNTDAETLSHRMRQLEAIREELSDAKHRLEAADAANVKLSCENAELAEALRDARVQNNRYKEEEMPEVGDDSHESDSFETLDLTSEPEPYCEPIAEVISEDDVHLEQKLADAQIPSFNLAEQIMAEQRKTSAARRQGPDTGKKQTQNGSIEHVVQQYVSGVQPPAPPTGAEASPTPRPEERTERFLRWQGETLSDYQQSLLGSIIQKDIRRFCGMDVPLMSLHRSMPN